MTKYQYTRMIFGSAMTSVIIKKTTTLRPRHQQGFPKIFRETSGRDFHLRMDDEECLRHLERDMGGIKGWTRHQLGLWGPPPQKKELFHP